MMEEVAIRDQWSSKNPNFSPITVPCWLAGTMDKSEVSQHRRPCHRMTTLTRVLPFPTEPVVPGARQREPPERFPRLTVLLGNGCHFRLVGKSSCYDCHGTVATHKLTSTSSGTIMLRSTSQRSRRLKAPRLNVCMHTDSYMMQTFGFVQGSVVGSLIANLSIMIS